MNKLFASSLRSRRNVQSFVVYITVPGGILRCEKCNFGHDHGAREEKKLQLCRPTRLERWRTQDLSLCQINNTNEVRITLRPSLPSFLPSYLPHLVFLLPRSSHSIHFPGFLLDASHELWLIKTRLPTHPLAHSLALSLAQLSIGKRRCFSPF